MSGYRPEDYWASQFGHDGLRATGHTELAASFNGWLYRNGQRNLDRFLRRNLKATPQRVFDAGIGTGFWVDHWYARGAQLVDGCDLVPAAVARVQARRAGSFKVANLADGRPTSANYPLVSAMNVLLHITSDAAFDRALAGLAEMVEDGGHLLIADAAVENPDEATPFDPNVHARVRSVASFAPPNLSLQAYGPTTVIGADPIEGSRVWKATWRGLRAVSRRGEAAGDFAGRCVYAIDPLLMRAGWSPSGKFLLFARRS
jgi:SAM-dependent methyltransferase